MATASNNDIARAIYSYSKESTDAHTTTKHVIDFLNRKRLMSRAPQILERLEKIIHKEEGRVIAKVTSSEALSHEHKNKIEQFLKKKYNAREISFKEIIDQGVIGGIKIEVDDEVIDLTIKNRIHKLQEYLIK